MQNNYFFKGQFSNIYKKSNKFSEVTSQILYGEKFKILSKNKKWIKIKTLFDNYVGYIKNKKYTDTYKVTHKVYRLKAYIFKKPSIELHISNIHKREEFRHKSLISDVVTGIICGLGTNGYILAINAMQELLKNGNR